MISLIAFMCHPLFFSYQYYLGLRVHVYNETLSVKMERPKFLSS